MKVWQFVLMLFFMFMLGLNIRDLAVYVAGFFLSDPPAHHQPLAPASLKYLV